MGFFELQLYNRAIRISTSHFYAVLFCHSECFLSGWVRLEHDNLPDLKYNGMAIDFCFFQARIRRMKFLCCSNIMSGCIQKPRNQPLRTARFPIKGVNDLHIKILIHSSCIKDEALLLNRRHFFRPQIRFPAFPVHLHHPCDQQGWICIKNGFCNAIYI